MKSAPLAAAAEKNAPKGGCFPVRWDRIVAGMSETDWSDLDVTELLPTGTVTLLLADVEGSTQLWESQPSAMTPAVEQLNRTASKLIAEHGGIRPVEQGEGDSFAFGLPDQPGRSITDTLLRYVRDRNMLLVLDNCEHLLEASAGLVTDMLAASSKVTILATSREPLLVPGEVNWGVPSLSLADEAIELFSDRARRAKPEFVVNENNAHTVTEICRRLDGMPLAIELAAARVRVLSLEEIVGSLHDRFRLLTGGARTAVRRQQTLRASVDWSHALLTESEHVLFRRLAVFMGGFDLDAAQAVAGTSEVERFQVLDQLSLLVDKSLIVAESSGGRTRYRLLETVRQYALEKLGESGEADEVRERHRDHYTALAAKLDAPARDDYERLLEQAEIEIDNLRTAFAWCHENYDLAKALELACSLQPIWLARGRIVEGLAWLGAARPDGGQHELSAAVRARALADKAVLNSWVDVTASLDQAQEALLMARDLDDAALLTRALTACACISAHDPELAEPYFADAISHAASLKLPLALIVIVKQSGFSGQRSPPASAWAQSDSRCSMPSTKHRLLHCEMPWTTTVSKQRGLRAPPYQPKRRSPTRSVVAASASDHQAAGSRSRPPNSTS
jgi:predicted ATPase